jgi:hypothetical protein
MKNRVPVPDDLAAEVMLRSDRTCCVCRIAGRKTQVHHIDENPANNAFENLAVICADCHSDAHTTHAFARNLSSDLIRKYNQNWRAIVHARLSLGADAARLMEYQQRALLELSLICHGWKVHYMSLYPGNFLRQDNPVIEGEDVWDKMVRVASHPYTDQEWRKYVPLFTDGINTTVTRLDQLLMAHGDVISVALKLAVLQTNSQLRVEQQTYLLLPQLVQLFEERDTALVARFRETIRTLARLARLADIERASTEGAHNKRLQPITREDARSG